jgi:phosphoethanolamine N-methyltransferase
VLFWCVKVFIDQSTAIFVCFLQYGCYVYGIDLSVNMILTALESAAAAGNGDKVSFEVSDARKRDFPRESFDAIFSRDAILHVDDKPALFARLFGVLKPGGHMVISDYCCGETEPSPEFASYVAARGYALTTVAEYAKLLKAAGFVGVMAEDRSSQLQGCLRAELARVEADGASFVSVLGEDAVKAAKESWRNKLSSVEAGHHRWGLFLAQKPV